ncbi:MAG: hypothetical protein ABIE70_06350 [bacterium]
MLKKIILSVALLGVIVAISYVKTVKGSRSEVVESVSENPVGSVEADVQPFERYQETLDSLRQVVASNDEVARSRHLTYAQQIDSLFDVLDSVECVLHDRDEDLAAADTAIEETAQPQTNQTEPAKKPQPKVNQRQELERKVVDYYKSQYSDLPQDLTDYERKVALYEVRLQTAREFNITLSRLKEIRQANGLSY